MVQADISQFAGECSTWREALRHYRDELTQDETRLQQVTTPTLSKDRLQNVEHLHNQFHIQLINIHDLKQAIKAHDRKINLEISSNNGQFHEETIADHESLFEQYQTLENTLEELRNEFSQFLNRTQ